MIISIPVVFASLDNLLRKLGVGWSTKKRSFATPKSPSPSNALSLSEFSRQKIL
jgi:hypothetical protein